MKVDVGIGVVPAFTSAAGATRRGGLSGSIHCDDDRLPARHLTEAGALPTGVAFVDNGNGTATLSGTPAAGTAGDYSLTFTATSPSGTKSQSFVLVVDEKPAITSAATATFRAGTPSSLTITTTGRPVPAPITATGSLPSGVTFVDNGNGTATLTERRPSAPAEPTP